MAGYIIDDDFLENELLLLSSVDELYENPININDNSPDQSIKASPLRSPETVTSRTRQHDALITESPVQLEIRQNNPQDCSNLVQALVDRATVEVSRTIIALNATFSQQLQEASISASNGIKSAQDSATSMVAVVSQSASIATSSAFSSVTVAQLAVTSANAAIESVSSASSSDVARLSASLGSLQADLDSAQASASSALASVQSALASATAPGQTVPQAPIVPPGQPMPADQPGPQDQMMIRIAPGKTVLLTPAEFAGIIIGVALGSILLSVIATLLFSRMRKKERDSYLNDRVVTRSPKNLPARLSSAFRTGNSMVIRFNPSRSSEVPPVPTRADSQCYSNSPTVSSISEKEALTRVEATQMRTDRDISTPSKPQKMPTVAETTQESETVVIPQKSVYRKPIAKVSRSNTIEQSDSTVHSIAITSPIQWQLALDPTPVSPGKMSPEFHFGRRTLTGSQQAAAEIPNRISDTTNVQIRPTKYNSHTIVEGPVKNELESPRTLRFSAKSPIFSIVEYEPTYADLSLRNSQRKSIEEIDRFSLQETETQSDSESNEEPMRTKDILSVGPSSLLSDKDGSEQARILSGADTPTSSTARMSDPFQSKHLSWLDIRYEVEGSSSSMSERSFEDVLSRPDNGIADKQENAGTEEPLSPVFDMIASSPHLQTVSNIPKPLPTEPTPVSQDVSVLDVKADTNLEAETPIDETDVDKDREFRGRSMIRTSDILDARMLAIERLKEGRARPTPAPTPPDTSVLSPSPPIDQLDRTLSPLRRNPVTQTSLLRLFPPAAAAKTTIISSSAATPSRHISPLRRNPLYPPPFHPPNTINQPSEPGPTKSKSSRDSSAGFSGALSKFQSLASQNPQEVIKAASEVNSRAIAGIYIPGSLREKAVRNVSKSRERERGKGTAGKEVEGKMEAEIGRK